MAGERRLPGNGFWGFWTLGTGGWKDGVDENFLRLSVLVQGAVRSRSAALPGNAVNGFIAIVPSTASANANQIAVRDEGAWTYLAPKAGVRLFVEDTQTFAYFDGAAWIEEAAGEVSTFLTLDDAPDTYGMPGQFLAVNALGDGLTWVDAPAPGGSGGGGGIEDAPRDGVPYSRKDGEWVPSPTGGSGAGDEGLAARHWRVRVLAGLSGSYVALAEMEFLDASGNRINALGSPIASSSRPNEGPDKLFDGVIQASGNGWNSQSSNVSTGSVWAGFSFNTPQTVSGVRLHQGLYDNEAPTSVVVEYSQNEIEWIAATEAWATGYTHPASNRVTTIPVVSKQKVLVEGEGVDRIVKLTQAQYDALDQKSDTALYVVRG